MKIAQMNSVFFHGDALSNIALINHRINKSMAYDSYLVADLFSEYQEASTLASNDYGRSNVFYLLKRFLRLDNKVYYLREYLKARKQYRKGNALNIIEHADIRIWHMGAWYNLLNYFHAGDILWYHGITYPYLSRYTDYAFESYSLLNTIKSLNPFIIVDSKFMQRDLVSQGFKKEQIHILPLPLTYSPLPPFKMRNITTPRLLTYGRYAMNKAIPELAESISKTDLNLTVFGDNNQSKEFSTEYSKAKLYANSRVKVLGKQKDILPFLENANIYISNSYHEGFCLPIIEAEANSLPVLARRGTAMDELVREGWNGYLFDDVSELPDLVDKILKDYARFARNAWEHSQRYTLEAYKERYLRLLTRWKNGRNNKE